MEKNKKTKMFIILLVITLLIVAITVVIISKKEKIISTTENVNNQTGTSDFSMKFLKLENKKQNMIYSPLSIKYALKMLYEGANGNTKNQIENLVGEEKLTKYDNIDKVLSLANAAYIRDSYSKEVKKDYKNILANKYNAEINYDSFDNAKNINEWIDKKTFGIIKNMISDGMVQNPDNKMILLNALAIDMEWENKFESNTMGDDFYLIDGSKMNASTMNTEVHNDSVSYYKKNDVTALTMDLKKYEDTTLQFVAIMPKENLPDYINNFTEEQLNKIINNSKKASKTKNGVEIFIPRFAFEYNLNLKSDLIELGITDIFDAGIADFSNISNTELFVGDALHKANIEFTEDGIKAAAVTAFGMCDTALIPETNPIEIKINKPFLYVIRDKKTGEIWFVGTVYEPSSWEDENPMK